MTQDKPTKTAMMELIEWVEREKSESLGYLTHSEIIEKAFELLEKEKIQIELAAIWGANYAIDNLGNAVADSGKAFETYFTQTYKQ
jgi:hypothetical protein